MGLLPQERCEEIELSRWAMIKDHASSLEVGGWVGPHRGEG